MGHTLIRTKRPSSELIASRQLLHYLLMQHNLNTMTHTYTD